MNKLEHVELEAKVKCEGTWKESFMTYNKIKQVLPHKQTMFFFILYIIISFSIQFSISRVPGHVLRICSRVLAFNVHLFIKIEMIVQIKGP